MTGGRTGGPATPGEDEVARLLAEAAGPEPIPGDVAARLDDVLAGLVAERSPARAHPGAVPLAARRRWPRMLLAAAAVVVGGYAVGSVAVQGTLSGSDSGDSSAASDGGAQDSLLVEDDGAGADADTEAAPEALEDTPPQRMSAPVRLQPETLRRDARRALDVLDALPAASTSGDATLDGSCRPPRLRPRERALPVRYDGGRAVLVAGPVRAGTVDVTVHSCTGEVLDRTTVRR